MVAIACGELVIFVNAKTAEIVKKIDCKKQSYVTCMQTFQDDYQVRLAVGFEDGDIIMVPLDDAIDSIEDDLFAFSEHDSGVTCIQFNLSGGLMVSGSLDNMIVLWDVIGRNAKCKFVGHSGSITSLNFYKNFNDTAEYILSSSKDGCLRVWDIDTRRCIDLIASKKNEVLGVNQIEGLKFVRNTLFMATTNSEEIIFYEMKVTAGENNLKIYHEERGRYLRGQYSGILCT